MRLDHPAAFIALGALVLIVVSAILTIDFSSPHSKKVAFCKEVLEKQLKAPSTVEYAQVRTHLTSDTASVDIDYDAQNAFGAMMRGKIECAFFNSEDTLQLRAVRLDGEPVDSTMLQLLNVQAGLSELGVE